MKKLFVLVLTILLCGCSANHRYSIVDMIGYDADTEGYKITAKIDMYDETVYMSEIGALPYETANKLSLTADKTVYMGEASGTVISRELAERGLKEIANALYTGRYSRGDDIIIISESRADEFLATNSGTTIDSAYSVPTTVQSFIKQSLLPARTALVQYIGETQTMCAIKDYTLKLVLSEQEAAGALLVLQQIKNGAKSVPVDGAFVGINIATVKTDAEVFCQNGNIIFRILPKIGFTAQDITSESEYKDKKLVKKIKENLNALISEEINAAFTRSKDSGIDFLGLENIYKQYFDDEFILANAEIEVSASSEIIYEKENL